MKDFKALNWYKTFGMKQLLVDVSFLIREGEHIGLIGRNGSGKSTLLKIMAKKDTYDAGETELPKKYSIAYVPQEADLNEEQTIFETIYESDSPIVQTVGKYEQASLDLQLKPDDEQRLKQFQIAEQEMNRMDGWQLNTTIQMILNKLGIKDMMQPIHELSGGQRKRVNLAKVLIDEPDLLLMDEPTNHLDFDMVGWLQNYIKNYKHAVFVVTHDRYFLDQISDRIFALDTGHLNEYIGNYQSYLEKKAHEEEIAAATQAKQKKLYKSELAWMRKGAKARTTKQQARINRFEDLKADVTRPSEVQGNVHLNFEHERLGKKVINVDDVTVGYANHPLLREINLLIQNGERIGIIGDNGAGKTTLLNTIADLQAPLAGTVEIGETVRMSYFKQMPEDVPADKRLINYIQEVAEEYIFADGHKVSASQMLEQFLFPRESHGMLIGSLSGGEKKRLYLLKLLMQRPNVLFLDEPTNDLDIDTLTVLEDYLETFSGTVITVSHDRYFLDKVIDKLLIADKTQQTVSLYYGNFSQYQADQKQSQYTQQVAKSDVKTATETTDTTVNKTKKKPLSYQEKKDWETIEEDIAKLETEIDVINQEMAANGSDISKLTDLQKELESKENHLQERLDYWEYLAERMEG